ncbi:MAG: hypothetical protein KW804_01490 [Candidatus Doudnabacteria bacterium]|nr:hypothetical protein [Candidatus Doudnabacteria bacterium]
MILKYLRSTLGNFRHYATLWIIWASVNWATSMPAVLRYTSWKWFGWSLIISTALLPVAVLAATRHGFRAFTLFAFVFLSCLLGFGVYNFPWWVTIVIALFWAASALLVWIGYDLPEDSVLSYTEEEPQIKTFRDANARDPTQWVRH